jgi:hypothetical protein
LFLLFAIIHPTLLTKVDILLCPLYSTNPFLFCFKNKKFIGRFITKLGPYFLVIL